MNAPVHSPAFASLIPPDMTERFNRARAAGRASLHIKNAIQALNNGLTTHAETEMGAALAALEKM